MHTLGYTLVYTLGYTLVYTLGYALVYTLGYHHTNLSRELISEAINVLLRRHEFLHSS